MNVLQLASIGRADSVEPAAGAAALGVRPEHIRLALAASGEHDKGAADTSMPATIETCEYFGSDTILSCLAKGQTVAVRAAGKHSLEPGTAVMLTWSRSVEHLFDAAGVAFGAQGVDTTRRPA